MKKGKQPLLYVLSSVASWAVDTGGFFVLSLLFGAALGAYSEPVCNVAARVISSFFNFNLNNRLVFQNTGSYGKALVRYYCLAVPQMLISAGLVALLSRLAETGASVLTTAIKFCVDILLFFISFRIQQSWVFKGKKRD